MKYNLSELYNTGRKAKAAEKAADEAKKTGILRGGSIGIMDDTGGKVEIAGTCHRRSFLRFLGFDNGVDFRTNLMFEAGYSNEDPWESNLKKALPDRIKCEEEIPIQWTVKGKSGEYIATGRPDMVITDDKGIPEEGIELKNISSVWTALTILLGEPKLTNVIQAANYSDKLGIPWQLVYTNRMNLAAPDFGLKKMTKAIPHWWETEVIEKNDKGNAKGIKPFMAAFEIINKAGQIYVTPKGVNGQEIAPERETIITIEGITKYYEAVIKMFESPKYWPGKPTNIDAFGNKLNYTACQYCELRDVCKVAKTRDEFVEGASKIFTKL